jgi:hypothetical protein
VPPNVTSPSEPPYVIGLHEVLWGGALIAVTMVIHAFGMLLALRVVNALKKRVESQPSFLKGISTLILASWVILLVHLLEVFSWALFFLNKKAINADQITPSLCYYFALLDYTTLGCPYNLVSHWRLLEGMIAMAGLLTFAWSTGVLLTLAQDFQDQQLQLLKQRREKLAARQKAK